MIYSGRATGGRSQPLLGVRHKPTQPSCQLNGNKWKSSKPLSPPFRCGPLLWPAGRLGRPWRLYRGTWRSAGGLTRTGPTWTFSCAARPPWGWPPAGTSHVRLPTGEHKKIMSMFSDPTVPVTQNWHIQDDHRIWIFLPIMHLLWIDVINFYFFFHNWKPLKSFINVPLLDKRIDRRSLPGAQTCCTSWCTAALAEPPRFWKSHP